MNLKSTKKSNGTFIYIYFIRLRMLQYNAIILHYYDDIIKEGKKILKKKKKST